MKSMLKYILGRLHSIQSSSFFKSLSHGFTVHSLANLSCVPEKLPTTKSAIKTDRNSLLCAGSQMLSMNPNAHLHPEPNQTGKALPQSRKAERERGRSIILRETTLFLRRLCFVPSSPCTVYLTLQCPRTNRTAAD